MDANSIYQAMIRSFDEKEWKYDPKDDQMMLVSRWKSGDIDNLTCYLRVNEKMELLKVTINLPFSVPDARRDDVAIAITHLNFAFADGCFCMDFDDGQLVYRSATRYDDNILTSENITSLCSLSINTAGQYAAQLMMLALGGQTLEQFVASLKKAN